MGEYVQNSDQFKNIRKTRWDLYKKELGSQLENVDLNKENLDELTGSMNEAIKTAFHKSCKEKKKGGKSKPEW